MPQTREAAMFSVKSVNWWWLKPKPFWGTSLFRTVSSKNSISYAIFLANTKMRCAHIANYLPLNPSAVSFQCGSLVDAYFPTLIAELEQLLDNPKQICSDLGLCNSIRMVLNGLPLTEGREGRVWWGREGIVIFKPYVLLGSTQYWSE